MCYGYERDQEHLLEFLKAAETDETTQQYLPKYVYGPKTHQEYLDLIGRERL